MSGPQEKAVRFVRKTLGIGEDVPLPMENILRGGSDRTFSRCRTDGRTYILMHYGLERQENALYVEIGRFLKDIGIRVPEIIAHDPDRRLVLMEDLGQEDLWALRNEPWTIRKELYSRTLTMAARLHAFMLQDFPVGRVQHLPAFGPELYRWERDYFREQFVYGVCNLSLEPAFASALEMELSALAERLLRTSPCLIHRDLQSQNVMVRNGETVWIDFQAMRPGSPFYDVASLLYDPYVSFTEEERLQLLRHYTDLVSHDLEWPETVTRFREAAVQRLMQALGAYGFLGVRQGKRPFLSHIPRGLDHLAEAAALSADLPCLLELIGKCRHALPASCLLFPPKSA
jgi:aminoglycoside/choline kinase family phosphotransferase